jgi:hypothetical protein
VSLLLALLLAPWPGLGSVFGTAYDAAANVFLRQLRIGGVQLELGPAPAVLPGPPVAHREWYVVLTIRNGANGLATRSALDVRALAYVPLAIFAALSIGAPLPSRRTQLRAAAVGFALVGLTIFVGTTAPVALLLDDARVGAIVLGDFGRRVVDTIFVATAESSVAAPGLLWLFSRFIADGAERGARDATGGRSTATTGADA